MFLQDLSSLPVFVQYSVSGFLPLSESGNFVQRVGYGFDVAIDVDVRFGELDHADRTALLFVDLRERHNHFEVNALQVRAFA